MPMLNALSFFKRLHSGLRIFPLVGISQGSLSLYAVVHLLNYPTAVSYGFKRQAHRLSFFTHGLRLSPMPSPSLAKLSLSSLGSGVRSTCLAPSSPLLPACCTHQCPRLRSTSAVALSSLGSGYFLSMILIKCQPNCV